MEARRRFWRAALLAWAAFVAVAFANGALRELAYRPLLGARAAEWISTGGLVVVLLLLTWGLLAWQRPRWTRRELPWLGLAWLVLTVAFEFLFFHYALGQPWEALLEAYALWRGRLWVVVLATVYFGPIVIGGLLKPARVGPGGRELRER